MKVFARILFVLALTGTLLAQHADKRYSRPADQGPATKERGPGRPGRQHRELFQARLCDV